MPKFKVVVSEDSGKTYQLEVETSALIGKKIGDVIEGSLIGLEGYKLKITGGSDKCGFPMRPDIPGTGVKRVLLSKGPGYRPREKGIRKRKSVRGNTISEDIVQVNTKIVEYGDKPVGELIGQG